MKDCRIFMIVRPRSCRTIVCLTVWKVLVLVGREERPNAMMTVAFHGKMHKTSVLQVSGRVPRAPGSDLSCDIGGPMPVRSLRGFYYFCLLKDLYTLCRYIFL